MKKNLPINFSTKVGLFLKSSIVMFLIFVFMIKYDFYMVYSS